MDNQSYWARRQMEREAQWHDLTTEELRKLKRYYVKAAADIERDIAALYAKYATENGLTMTAARKLIRGDEFKSWRLTLEEYVRKSKVDPKILRELNTLTARSRISRLEALHARTLMETIDLAERLQEAADAHLARAYLETYYGNLYDFHKTIGLSTPPNAVDAKRVESVLQTAWVGKNYSSRIWANQAKLANELEQTLLQAIHRGSSIQQLSKALSRRMDVAYSNAERLIRTELNAVENRASAAAMKVAEFTHYQFMATLDRRTCSRCGERDGEVYKLSEMNQGENAPPMHARCRCTIVAYDGLQYGTRAARDFGDSLKGKSVSFDADESGDKKIKTPFGEVNGTKVKITLSNGEVVDHYRRVPADMSYRDWKAVYIDKTKTFETWQAEFDARRKSDEQSPLRQRGRQVIEDLAAGRLPTAASGGKVGLAAGNINLTVTQGTPPKLIGKLENVTASAIQKTLEYYEAQIVTAPVEHAIIITQRGDIYHCSGDVHGLPYSYFERLRTELEGSHVTHNHPPAAEENENTFSDDDIRRFSYFKMARLRGIDERFVYELNRNPEDNEFAGHDLNEIYSMNLNFEDYHVAVMIKALVGGFGYRRWFR